MSIIIILIFDIGAVTAGMAGRALFPDLADAETVFPLLARELFPPIITGVLGPDSYPHFKYAFLLLYVVIGTAAILSFGRAGPTRVVESQGLFILFCTLLHVLAGANSRYRFPVMPFVVVMASLWLSRPGLPRGFMRSALVGATGIGFLWLCWHYAVNVLP